MSRISSLADWFLRLPLLWGGLACLAFYVLIGTGAVDSAVIGTGLAEEPLADRYFKGHFVEYITTALFFVGCAALVLRMIGVAGQFGVMRRSLLDPLAAGGQPVEESGLLLSELTELPEYLRKTYLVRRLHDAIDGVRRRDSAEGLDEELSRLEDDDRGRMADGYSMVQIICWAMPMLGFLGTVMGITLAIADLNMEALMEGTAEVTSGLAVAFDTTAVALTLTILLMLSKFAVQRVESRLLEAVDVRCRQELVGRFQQLGTNSDPHVNSVHRMCDQVVRAVETMSARQADLWKTTIDETNEHWARSLANSGDQFADSLASGLRENLRDHATGLIAGAENQLSTLNERLAGQVLSLEQAVAGSADLLAASLGQQAEAIRQSIELQMQGFTASVQQQSDQLDSGTGELLGNLRNGLERMAELLVEALQKHGETLTEAENELATENRRHLSEVEAALGEAMVVAADRQEKLIGRSEDLLREMQTALVDAAGATISHQEQLVKQGEVLLKVVDSTNQIQRLEETVAQNLSTLGRTHNFEETLLSLSAAIQLLSARVGRGDQPSLSTTSQAA